MAIFASRLRQLREERKLSLDEFAKLFNTYRSTIWRYENNKRQPTIDFAIDVARYFNVSLDWLVGDSDIRDPNVDSTTLSDIFNSLPDQGKIEIVNYAKYLKQKYQKHNTIKVLGCTAAGQPIDYVDNSFTDEVNVKNVPKKADFALTVKGDSMEPLIKNGSLIWIKSQPTVENGEIAVIELDGSVTCKKVYINNGTLELRSINPKYKPIILKRGNVKIIGKVILEG